MTMLLTSVLLLSGCHLLTINHRISESTEIPIPDSIRIDYEDTHGGFHGDGDTLAIVKFDGDTASGVRAEISKQPHWKRLPLSESLEVMMYGGVINGITYTHEYAELLKMPRVDNGYWFFEDRQLESGLSKEGQDLFPRASYNFTLAVYDADTDILYYLEVDT